MYLRYGLTTRLLKKGQLFVALLFLVLIAPRATLAGAPTQAQGRFYSETGHTLSPQFVNFYDSHGGLALFGYPVTEARYENGYLVQWTERERLEWHPDNTGTPYEVLLGLLGRELTAGLEGPHFAASATSQSAQLDPNSPEQRAYFHETGQAVDEPFLSYWRQHGGVSVFGYPVSASYVADGLRVQWFERARFEYHPELPDPFKVSLGHVGLEALRLQGSGSYEMTVSDKAAADGALKLGLSQGGESSSPNFLENTRGPVGALGPGAVRLDNIFNFYHVVRLSAAGTPEYHWDELDTVLATLQQMGKQPFICLSYMPEPLSSQPGGNIYPPANYDEWAKLVAATVLHLKQAGFTGLQWEVWNEPNIWDFWRGSFEDYLRLYDATSDAIVAVDPSARIGGPAFSSFEPMGIDAFLQHESERPGARVDFVSWHMYGRDPDQVSDEVRRARKLLENHPALHPMLYVTEFNVLQGGSGDTSAYGYTDTVEGAISTLETLQSMERERLDAAYLFELKDGEGPRDYWGRWGLLTYRGHPKPTYYALQAYMTHPAGRLPVSAKGSIQERPPGLLAFGSPAKCTLLLWYNGRNAARVKIALPTSFVGTNFSVTLFDKSHNNPAATGDSTLTHLAPLSAGDLVFNLAPGSLVVLTTADK